MPVVAQAARRWISPRPCPDIRAGLPEGRWVLLPSDGEEDAVTYAASNPPKYAGQVGRLWWLPAGGRGNGLDDDSWAPILEVSDEVVPQVLSMLRKAGVPAYAAPARPAKVRLQDRSARPAGCQLWVGASAYARAETALVTAMPSLVRKAAEHADAAWR
jgi:hypothetical protein